MSIEVMGWLVVMGIGAGLITWAWVVSGDYARLKERRREQIYHEVARERAAKARRDLDDGDDDLAERVRKLRRD
jgi:hypothetical protein